MVVRRLTQVKELDVNKTRQGYSPLMKAVEVNFKNSGLQLFCIQKNIIYKFKLLIFDDNIWLCLYACMTPKLQVTSRI